MNIDRNEFNKTNVNNNGERVRLGRVVLEFGCEGSLTDECMNEFFSKVKAIDTLVIRGLLTDINENLQYIKGKLDACNVYCGTLECEVVV